MNRIYREEDFMMYVEKRLEHWATWFNSSHYYGLGFHSETIEYILMTVGVLIKSTCPKPLPVDEDAEEIERLVTKMAKHNDKMAAALRLHYFDRKKSRDRVDAIHMSSTQFKHHVKMAKQWLAGRLSADKDN